MITIQQILFTCAFIGLFQSSVAADRVSRSHTSTPYTPVSLQQNDKEKAKALFTAFCDMSGARGQKLGQYTMLIKKVEKFLQFRRESEDYRVWNSTDFIARLSLNCAFTTPKTIHLKCNLDEFKEHYGHHETPPRLFKHLLILIASTEQDEEAIARDFTRLLIKYWSAFLACKWAYKYNQVTDRMHQDTASQDCDTVDTPRIETPSEHNVSFVLTPEIISSSSASPVSPAVDDHWPLEIQIPSSREIRETPTTALSSILDWTPIEWPGIYPNWYLHDDNQ